VTLVHGDPENGPTRPDLSVVIPSYNQKQTVAGCLTALLNQRTTVPYEVIVVDSSDNGTEEILRGFVPSIRLIRSDARLYGGAALNRGIEHARGRIIACTSTNIIVDENWIQGIHDAHETHEVVGGPVLNANPRSLIGWSLFLFEFGEFMGKRDKTVVHMPSCNLSFKKAHLGDYGSFPDGHLSYDLIFTARIKTGIFFSKSVVTSHINRTDYPSVLRHSYLLGYGSATARDREPMTGRFLLAWRFLIPLLWVYRFLKVGYRASRSGYFLIFLLTSPMIAGNLISWNLGFWVRASQLNAERRTARADAARR
jgi:glycosyltransferase involved in cell wall biosynthesis